MSKNTFTIELDAYQARVMLACMDACIRTGGGSATFTVRNNLLDQMQNVCIDDDAYYKEVGYHQTVAHEEYVQAHEIENPVWIKDEGVAYGHVLRTQEELEKLPDYNDIRNFLIEGNDPHDMCAAWLQTMRKDDIEGIRQYVYENVGSSYDEKELVR